MNQNSTTFAGAFLGRMNLQELIDRLVITAQAEQINKNSIVNEVPAELCINGGEFKLSALINELLETVFTNARNGDIHISADCFRDTVTLRIEDRNNYNGYALASRLKHIEPDARKIGGDISICGQQQLVATVSFCFPN